MTERVEQEYLRYIEERRGGAPGETVTVNIKEVAQHFYDLALKDVKKEAKRVWKIAKNSEDSPTYKCGVLHGTNAIVAFIEIQLG